MKQQGRRPGMVRRAGLAARGLYCAATRGASDREANEVSPWLRCAFIAKLSIARWLAASYSAMCQRRTVDGIATSFQAFARRAWKQVALAIIMAMGCTVALMLLDRRDASDSDITIRATGMQWKWGFDYLHGEGEGIAFVSSPRPKAVSGEGLREVDHPVVVPVNKKIRIVLNAVDVIHEWYIPALGVNQPAVPSLSRDTWFRAERTGVYRGACSDLCGPDHLCLPIVIEVVSEDGYKQWVAARKRT